MVHFLKHLVEGEPKFKAEPWYNSHGDCIVYQMADEAVVADRIDEVLTIYKSAADDRPIGFQIKGVRALVQKFGWDGLSCDCEENDRQVVRVSLAAMLLAAYENGPNTFRRRKAYAAAMEHPAPTRITRDELMPA